MKQVTCGNRVPFEIRNKTVRGIRGYISLWAAVANTPLVNSDLDLNKIKVKITLLRGGNKVLICDDSLRNLMAATNWENELFFASSAPVDFGRVNIAAVTLVKQNIIVPFAIDWKLPIGLKGDKMVIDFNFVNSAASAAVDQTKTVANIAPWASTGIETDTPIIQIDPIQESVSSYPLEPRSNVTRIMFINFDEKNVALSTEVLQDVSLSSDLFEDEIDRFTLFTDQMTQFESFLDENGGVDLSREQSFLLYGGHNKEMLNNVQGTLTLNGPEVTANNNVVAMISHVTFPSTYVRGHKRAAAIQAIKLSSLGAPAVAELAAVPHPVSAAMISHNIKYTK